MCYRTMPIGGKLGKKMKEQLVQDLYQVVHYKNVVLFMKEHKKTQMEIQKVCLFFFNFFFQFKPN